MALRDALLPEFDAEMANTRKCLARIPDDKFGFKPHGKSWPMGTLASHLARIPTWVQYTLAMNELDLAAPQAPEQNTPFTSAAALLAAFDRHVAEGRAAIAAAGDDVMAQPWTLKMGSQTFFTLPKAAVLRTYVLSHAVHHRAQLTIYMRLNDIPVPGMYGPSADEGM
jgi:uncharacterized damage-inducible protein DinB